ncbi:MAG: SagB/ThcOx family dehydrogenase [Caldilineaceae bacterium]|nr:SagB/ThcOx family dehydrogenase [Caldilineaceae bacterium]
MTRRQFILLGLLLAWIGTRGVVACTSPKPQVSRPKLKSLEPVGDIPMLPTPAYRSETSLEQALLQRRSVRAYQDAPLRLAEIAQLLWAAQGVTHPEGYRTAPSAGALYPIEVYLVAGEVDGCAPGLYHYQPQQHRLAAVALGEWRAALSSAALDQESVRDAPAAVVLTAVAGRTTPRYAERGIQYIHMEVGSVAQNIYLQAAALGLGTVFVGAFDDEAVRQVLNLPETETPLAVLPIGRPAADYPSR